MIDNDLAGRDRAAPSYFVAGWAVAGVVGEA